MSKLINIISRLTNRELVRSVSGLVLLLVRPYGTVFRVLSVIP